MKIGKLFMNEKYDIHTSFFVRETEIKTDIAKDFVIRNATAAWYNGRETSYALDRIWIPVYNKLNKPEKSGILARLQKLF